MNVLMLSSDQRICERGSAAFLRMKAYGALVDRLDIVVLSVGGAGERVVISDKVSAYKTASWNSLLRARDAYRIGRGLPRPDIVTSQDPFETGISAARLSKYFGAALELQVHTDLFSPYFRSESLKNRARVWLARRALNKAECIRVVSPRIRDSIVRELNVPARRIAVLPIASPRGAAPEREEIQRVKTILARFEHVVLTVSRLAPEKNLLFALRAFAVFHAKYPRVGYCIVGDGICKDVLRREAVKLGIDNAVEFVGWEQNLQPYYALSNTYFSSSRYEGYGMSLIDAARAGLAIATTDVGCVGTSLFGAGVCVYPQDDLTGAVLCLTKFLENPEKPVVREALSSVDYERRITEHWRTCRGA